MACSVEAACPVALTESLDRNHGQELTDLKLEIQITIKGAQLNCNCMLHLADTHIPLGHPTTEGIESEGDTGATSGNRSDFVTSLCTPAKKGTGAGCFCSACPALRYQLSSLEHSGHVGGFHSESESSSPEDSSLPSDAVIDI